MRVILDAGAPSLVHLDPLRLRQIVMHGIANSETHGSPAPGAPDAPIDLVAGIAPDGGLAIEVLDRGAGLRGRTLADLSRKFMQLPVGNIESIATSSRVSGGGGGGRSGGEFDARPRGDVDRRGALPPPRVSAFNLVRSTGMGIPLCARLATLMGGSLELGDRVDGPGAPPLRSSWQQLEHDNL